jgi:hypothetical protein
LTLFNSFEEFVEWVVTKIHTYEPKFIENLPFKFKSKFVKEELEKHSVYFQ